MFLIVSIVTTADFQGLGIIVKEMFGVQTEDTEVTELQVELRGGLLDNYVVSGLEVELRGGLLDESVVNGVLPWCLDLQFLNVFLQLCDGSDEEVTDG